MGKNQDRNEQNMQKSLFQIVASVWNDHFSAT
jgi:hypothetical protein